MTVPVGNPARCVDVVVEDEVLFEACALGGAQRQRVPDVVRKRQVGVKPAIPPRCQPSVNLAAIES